MGKVINIKKSGGLGIQAPSNDGICGLILQVPAPGSASYVIGNVYKIGSLADLLALGLTEAFCDTNKSMAYQAVKEFFDVNLNGTLYIMLFAQTATTSFIFDTATLTSAMKMINHANGDIKTLAIAFSPDTEPSNYETTLTTAIPLAQAFQAFNANLGREMHMLVEGHGVTGSTTNLRTLNSPNVSVVIGQNATFYNMAGTWNKKHTAIGMALGTVSLAPVNHNIGHVGNYNLVGAMQDCLINGVLFANMTAAQLQTIDDNGYIYLKKYVDYPGIYWNDSYTCTVVTNDFATIEANRTWNKASRLIRAAMTPYINSPVLIDPATGQLDSVTISTMEAAGNRVIRVMFTNEEISGPDPQGPTPPFRIDPNQDVLANSNINTMLSIVPTGTARTITNYIGLTNPNN